MSTAATGAAPHGLVIDQPALARQINRLPMLPRAVIEALRILRDDAANADACADHITRDQALTARTLRLANSAFYGLPGRVGTIRHALDVLGRRTLGALVTTAAVATQFSPSNCPGFDFKAYWRHALGAAIAAESLAIELGRDTGLAFSAGLLHDIGRLALVTFFPAQMGAVLAAARAQDLPQRQVERQQLGVDHTQVGGMIAAHWHFPPAVVTAIDDHHAAQPADLAAMVQVADAVVHALDLDAADDEAVPRFDGRVWDALGLTPTQALRVFERTETGVTTLTQALAV